MTDAFVAVLTAAGGVSDDAVKAARAALHGRAALIETARRLSSSAVEIPFRSDIAPGLTGAVPDHDLNVVPATGREKAVLIADMDSTMIGVECIDELADFAGLKPEVSAITEQAMRGDLDFEGALDARVALLRGMAVETLRACYDARVRLNPGAADLVGGMAARGASTALVSGGFTFFADKVAAAAGFGEALANVLETEDGKLTGRVLRPIVDRATKARTLDRLVEAKGVALSAAVAVGDGANDLDMIRAAGLGVAYKAKPALKAEADAILDYSDLTAILTLQGIAT